MKQAIIYSCHLEERANEPDNERQIALCKEYAEQNGIESSAATWIVLPQKKSRY